jgi:hypothetical protein
MLRDNDPIPPNGWNAAHLQKQEANQATESSTQKLIISGDNHSFGCQDPVRDALHAYRIPRRERASWNR